MTFYVNLTNGSSLATIQDGTIDTTSSSITLIGKNFPTYGQLLNQNLISMLENFANTTNPNAALTGQIWYDSGNNVLKYYRGGGATPYWQNIANILFGSTNPTNPQQNDLWWDSTNQQLKFYDQLNWITIGPLTANDGFNRVSGTNSFIVQIGGNNLFTIDAYGRVNAPYNPVFQGTGFITNTVFTGSGLTSPQTWKPNVTINTGNFYSATTGQFTCPVKGIYMVSANAVSLGYVSGVTSQYITWWKNQADTGISAKARHIDVLSGDTFHVPLAATGYLNCNIGDTIQCVLSADTNGQIDYNNASISIRLVA